MKRAAVPQKGLVEAPKPKKQRFVWSESLHRHFVGAVFDIGLKKASPKLLLDAMAGQGEAKELTSEHLKSHLQKFRLRQEQSKEDFWSKVAPGVLASSICCSSPLPQQKGLGGGGGGDETPWTNGTNSRWPPVPPRMTHLPLMQQYLHLMEAGQELHHTFYTKFSELVARQRRVHAAIVEGREEGAAGSIGRASGSEEEGVHMGGKRGREEDAQLPICCQGGVNVNNVVGSGHNAGVGNSQGGVVRRQPLPPHSADGNAHAQHDWNRAATVGCEGMSRPEQQPLSVAKQPQPYMDPPTQHQHQQQHSHTCQHHSHHQLRHLHQHHLTQQRHALPPHPRGQIIESSSIGAEHHTAVDSAASASSSHKQQAHPSQRADGSGGICPDFAWLDRVPEDVLASAPGTLQEGTFDLDHDSEFGSTLHQADDDAAIFAFLEPSAGSGSGSSSTLAHLHSHQPINSKSSGVSHPGHHHGHEAVRPHLHDGDPVGISPMPLLQSHNRK
ncbi:unnamed protein product [Chrysoparadoxa australica]